MQDNDQDHGDLPTHSIQPRLGLRSTVCDIATENVRRQERRRHLADINAALGGEKKKEAQTPPIPSHKRTALDEYRAKISSDKSGPEPGSF